MFDTAFSRQSD